jgi:hypothetical protein
MLNKAFNKIPDNSNLITFGSRLAISNEKISKPVEEKVAMQSMKR